MTFKFLLQLTDHQRRVDRIGGVSSSEESCSILNQLKYAASVAKTYTEQNSTTESNQFPPG